MMNRTAGSFFIATDRFREKYGIPGSILKIIAIITMLIDHTGATVIFEICRLPQVMMDPAKRQLWNQIYYCSRRIGRIAFPIFCFLLVEGFLHTRNIKKYAMRMLIFALLSDFPFDWALHPGQAPYLKQNVYFTLLIGLLVLWAVKEMNGQIPLQVLFLIMGLLLAHALHTDYAERGVFLIELLYILRRSRLLQCLCGGAFMEYELMPTPLAFIPVFLYNGKRGRQLKYFYYCFYPGHLLILGIIRNLIMPELL